MPIIYIDADACPVKDEVYKVAKRYSMRVVVVAKSTMHIPIAELIELVVRPGFEEVDDWIVETTSIGDIVITADILLADRCLKKESRVLDPRGEEFSDNNIGNAIAMRELMSELRQTGEARGGPSAMTPKNRSRFLATLDELINAVRKEPRTK